MQREFWITICTLQEPNNTREITRTCNKNEGKLETLIKFDSDKRYDDIKINIKDLDCEYVDMFKQLHGSAQLTHSVATSPSVSACSQAYLFLTTHRGNSQFNPTYVWSKCELCV